MKKGCFRCGKKYASMVHHHIPPKHATNGTSFWDYEVKFLIPVCPDCHKILDDETRSSKGLLNQYNWVVGKMKWIKKLEVERIQDYKKWTLPKSPPPTSPDPTKELKDNQGDD